jgi:hypothetical protein
LNYYDSTSLERFYFLKYSLPKTSDMKFFTRFAISISAMIFSTILNLGCRKDVSNTSANASTIDLSQGGKFVQTPFGWKPASQVHFIEPGTFVLNVNGRFKKIDSTTHKVLEDLGEVSPSVGKESELNQNSPSQTKLSDVFRNENGPPGGAGGWVTYSQWIQPAVNPITSFSTTWIVPPAPTANDNQVVYIWNGLWDGGNSLMQSVLQWGVGGNQGGPSWIISCWYGKNGTYMHGANQSVSPGTTVTGLVSGGGGTVGQSNYGYSATFTGTTGLAWTVSGVDEFTYAVEVLEADGITQRNDFPYGTPNSFERMTGIYMLQSTGGNPVISWSPEVNAGATFNQYTSIISNNTKGSGEVDLYFVGPCTTPAAPSGISWNDSTLTLSWNPISGISDYIIKSLSTPTRFGPYFSVTPYVNNFFQAVGANDSTGTYKISIQGQIANCGTGPATDFTINHRKR